ncbi:MAG: hypothetical protein ACI87J_001550 [Colwellia sp.]|jgi:hypothetical protein
MQTLFDFAVTGSKLSSLDTCLLLQTNDITTLDTTPLTLAGGDILEVGDQFTGIDEAGSAGKPPLKITDGWYQQYEGSIYIASDASGWVSNDDRKLLMFSSWEIITGESSLEGLKSDYKHQYLAYIAMTDGTMMYWNSCGSSRVIKCNSVARISINKQQAA